MSNKVTAYAKRTPKVSKQKKEPTVVTNTNSEMTKEVLMNLRVSEKFRRDAKLWCTERDISMTEAFVRGMQLFQQAVARGDIDLVQERLDRTK